MSRWEKLVGEERAAGGRAPGWVGQAVCRAVGWTGQEEEEEKAGPGARPVRQPRVRSDCREEPRAGKPDGIPEQCGPGSGGGKQKSCGPLWL